MADNSFYTLLDFFFFLADILLRTFTSMFMREIGPKFSFLVIFFLCWYLSDAPFFFFSFFSFYFLWTSLVAQMEKNSPLGSIPG